MKICFFISTLRTSAGSERVSVLLANKLASENFEVSVICWQGGNESFFKLDGRVKQFYLFEEFGINIYKNYHRSFFRYYKIIKKLKPDYIVDVCVALSILTAPISLLTRTKVIGWEHFNTNVSWNSFTAELSRRLTSRISQSVVVLTKTDVLNYSVKYNAQNTICIPNPLTIEADGECDYGAKYVVAVGRLTKQKGFDILLKIWSDIIIEFPEWHLRIVGDGEDKGVLNELILELNLRNNVSIHQPTLRIADFYKTSSVYAMTSRYEGLPLVLIEAKGFGLPIISFDCETGPRDIVNNDKDGFLIEYENFLSYCLKFKELLKDQALRERLGKFALEDVKRFDVELFVNSWKALFSK